MDSQLPTGCLPGFHLRRWERGSLARSASWIMECELETTNPSAWRSFPLEFTTVRSKDYWFFFETDMPLSSGAMPGGANPPDSLGYYYWAPHVGYWANDQNPNGFIGIRI